MPILFEKSHRLDAVPNYSDLQPLVLSRVAESADIVVPVLVFLDRRNTAIDQIGLYEFFTRTDFPLISVMMTNPFLVFPVRAALADH